MAIGVTPRCSASRRRLKASAPWRSSRARASSTSRSRLSATAEPAAGRPLPARPPRAPGRIPFFLCPTRLLALAVVVYIRCIHQKDRRSVMFLILQIISVLLVALATALPLAHALELPGKMRLEKSDYLVTQPIYYPGFTIAAGIGEGGGMLATLALLLMTPPRGAQFALTLAALIALVAMHVAYWLCTHPVNKFWLEGEPLKGFGAGF